MSFNKGDTTLSKHIKMGEDKVFSLKLGPAHIITLSFVFVILVGATILSMPFASASGEVTNFVDALFTATSAVCVTGLVVVTTASHWSFAGKVIIMLLIQIGALGFISLFTIVLIALGKKITLKERILIQESFNLTTFNGMVQFLKTILKWVIVIEGLGAILLSLVFIPKYGFANGIFMGVFHSISAFCNAGFDILGDDSMIPYANNYFINIVLMFLIIMGGLGFNVWIDLSKYVKKSYKRYKGIKTQKHKLSVHTRLALITSIFLILLGFVMTLILEFNNPDTIGNFTLSQKILSSIFQSVTLRTAGFDAISQADLTYGSKFMAVFIMAVGGSPGGTAGGIKTVTVAVLFLAIFASIKGRVSITAFQKSISFYTVQKALTVAILMISLILVATTILTVTEQGIGVEFEFIDILYEVSSALGTVGLSSGVTGNLSFAGKFVVIFCMFVGRLGPVTVALALSFNKNEKTNAINYPKEKVIVG